MSAATLPSTAHDLSNTYGASFLTAFLSTALWGVTCAQTFNYFIGYPKDRTWLKCLVIWLWLMDTIHEAILIEAMYRIFVSRFGDVASLVLVPKDYMAKIMPTVLVASAAQLFFTYRIWIFSERKWIFPLVAIPMIVGQSVLQTVYMGNIIANNTLAELKKENPIGITFSVMAMVTDISLAGCMIYLLRAERNGSGASGQVVSKLILFSFNSGLWTALVALAVVITSLTTPLPDLIRTSFYTMLSPLYCNTVMANLNSRRFLRSTMSKSAPSHGGSRALELETFSRGAARAPQNVINIQVGATEATDKDSLQEGHERKVTANLSFA